MSTDEPGTEPQPEARILENEVDPESSYGQSLSLRGFEPGETVYEFYECFSLEDLQQSLFGSSYDKPITVPLKSKEMTVALEIVITMLGVRYPQFAYARNDSPAGSYQFPDWYAEGWILKSGFDQFDDITRVRMHIDGNREANGTDDVFLWQVIPKGPNPDAKFVTAH